MGYIPIQNANVIVIVIVGTIVS